MDIQAVDSPKALKEVLQAPPETQLERYKTHVMRPLEPFWETLFAWSPQARPDTDAEIAAARIMNFFLPEHGSGRGLEALAQLEDAGSFGACLNALHGSVEALHPEAHGIGLEKVIFALVLVEPGALKESQGYAGWGAKPGLVMVTVFPNEVNLPKLPAATAHEFHHNVRLSFEPFRPDTVTLGQYLVLEGLAQAFEAERFGEDKLGPWATSLAERDVGALTGLFGQNLRTTGFNTVRAFMFGDWAAEQSGYEALGIPSMAGYAMGYRTVKAFLKRTGKSVAEATYLPWEEIVETSGHFGEVGR